MTSVRRHDLLRTVGMLIMAGWALAVALAAGTDLRHESPRLVASTNGSSLQISNSREGTAILSAAAMKPGQSTTGTVTITNAGSVDGDVSLDAENLLDTPTASSQKLSTLLDLTIDDITATQPVRLYSGKLGAMPTLAAGTIDKRTAHTYRFTVAFPAGAAATNGYQGKATRVDYTWSLVQAKKK